MAIVDRISAAADDRFSGRVAMLLMKVCVDVANEATNTTNHANRMALANLHFRGLVNVRALAAAVIASNATIQAAIDGSPAGLGSNVSDGDIEFVLSGLFNAFANAYAAA